MTPEETIAKHMLAAEKTVQRVQALERKARAKELRQFAVGIVTSARKNCPQALSMVKVIADGLCRLASEWEKEQETGKITLEGTKE